MAIISPSLSAKVQSAKRQLDHKCQPPELTYEKSNLKEGNGLLNVKTDVNMTVSDNNLISSKDQNRKYSCTTCKKKFKSKSNLNNHMRSHTRVYPFNCTNCKRFFDRKKRQLDHKCQPEQSTYDTSNFEEGSVLLNVTIDVKMGDSDANCISSKNQNRNYSCTTCEKKCKSKRDLADHRSCHTRVYPFNCTNYKRDFNRRHKLLNHICQKYFKDERYYSPEE